MKFNEYLTETYYESTGNEIIETLEKDCVPFLKESNELFWRGMAKIRTDDIRKVIPRDDRLPKDVPIEVHKTMDNAFKKYFGWNARSNGVFATTNKYESMNYGNPVMMFPIGNTYKYVYSKKVDDLLLFFKNSHKTDFSERHFYYDDTPATENDVKDVEEFVRVNYTNKKLISATNIEVMFYCPKGYYIVTDDYQFKIKGYFNK